MGRRVKPGSPEPLGVVPAGDGVNAAFPAPNAEAIELCLFDASGEVELERVRLAHRTGDVFHAHVAGVAVGTRYGLRVHGPFEPWRGHRFNAAKLLVDPWATRLDRAMRLDPLLFDTRRADPAAAADAADSARVMPKAIVEAPSSLALDTRPRVPWDRTILYELGVKAFTALHPDVPEAQRGTFAALGHAAVVGYLRDLGVTSVEILPAAAWIDERHLPALGLTNAWGYNPVGFCAPDPRLAPGGWPEVRAAVEALHAAGLEVIVDVVLNHSGESDELGPTLSLRGLDNAAYYRLRPDDPALYVNDAGCGNVLALDRPPALRLAMDALRTWALRGGVDGFRFDLAATLGRRPEGFDPDAPLLQAIAQDPVLRDLKLIAEPWDIGPGGYQPGRFPAGWAEWNDRYRDDVRRFWRGDGGMVGALATRLAGSQDLFAAKRRPSRGINFVTAHDGFTLADLVSYERKHNEANGEDNRDGTNANHSWNGGVEGPTDDPAVRRGRLADQRALLATLLLGRGTPMIAMGAEAGRTQHGNNNAYAQDNPLGWFDWAAADGDLLAFARRLTGLRQRHASLREDRFLTGELLFGEAEPDVAWRRLDGAAMTQDDWSSPGRVLVCDRTSRDEGGSLDRTLVILNGDHDPVEAVLPWPRAGHVWTVVLDSAEDDAGDDALVGGDRLAVGPRRVVLLAERPEDAAPRGGRGQGRAPDDALGRLATAAGIAAEWWEETGVRHVVTPDTQRALLAAMGCPVVTAADALEHLQALAHDRDGRVLPHAATMTAGRMMPLRLGSAAVTAGRLVLTPEEGEERVIAFAAARDVSPRRGADGRSRRSRVIDLPELPAGRWRVTLEDHPDEACRLTVAPPHCHWPESWSDDVRRFGLAAHLYALRREGDQGIGDFTTLAETARKAADAGAVTLGLNPLHALFDRQRDRASPYQPSDRHFCDPISIDLAALGPLDPGGWSASDLAESREVDYPAVWALKHRVLEAAYGRFRTLPADHLLRQRFAAFVQSRGERLVRFAAFEALSALRPGPWQDWPADWRDPGRATALVPPDTIAFRSFLQFVCDLQLEEAAARSGLALGFYRDLAVGAAPDGAEAWANPAAYARGVSIGAPPDLFSRDGQVWMLPPPNPLVQERTGGADFAALVAANMRHAGALRIDHVMGLSRLFWVPEGAPAASGAYVDAPFHHLIGQLALESRRHRCLVVGEDLGTVQEGLRERLAQARVLSYRVTWFEREGEGFSPPASWPVAAVACASTHDLPTIRGWWTGADIEERHALGLFTATDAAAAWREREAEKRRLLEALDRAGVPAWPSAMSGDLPDAVALALHAFVSRTPCNIALAQLDDLGRERVGVNLPGTDRERPNWRRRMTATVGDLFDDRFARRVIEAMAEGRR